MRQCSSLSSNLIYATFKGNEFKKKKDLFHGITSWTVVISNVERRVEKT